MKQEKPAIAYVLPRATLLFSAGIVLLLTGCTNMNYKQYGVAPLGQKDKPTAGLGVINTLHLVVTTKTDTDGKPSQTGTALVDDSCFAASDPKDAACKAGRNRSISALMLASDDLCTDHLRDLYGGEVTANMATGTLALLTAGWSTVSSALPTKTALSSLSMFFSAERSLINEVAYKDKLITAVTAKIRQIREAKASKLVLRYADDITAYPMMDALKDVSDYHLSCSFGIGLETVLHEGDKPSAETQKAKLELELQQVQNTLDIRTANKGLDQSSIDLLKKRRDAIQESITKLNADIAHK